MLTLEECVSNVVTAKAVHCAYSPYKFSALHTDEYVMYKTALESYTYWYDLTKNQFKLKDIDLKPVVKEGFRVFRVIQNTEVDLESSLTPANLKPHINLRGILRTLEQQHFALKGISDIKEVVTTNPTVMPKAHKPTLASAFLKAVTSSVDEIKVVKPVVSAYAAKRAAQPLEPLNLDTLVPTPVSEAVAEAVKPQAVAPEDTVTSVSTDYNVPRSVDNDEWAIAKDFPLYECSRSGLIRSAKRPVVDADGRKFMRGGKVLTSVLRKNDVHVVTLRYNLDSSANKIVKVADVIARTFLENLPEHFKVRMKDGNNNNLELSNYIIEAVSKEDVKDSIDVKPEIIKPTPAKEVMAHSAKRTEVSASSVVSLDSVNRNSKGVSITVTLPEYFINSVKEKSEIIDMSPEEYLTRAVKKYLTSVLTIC